MDNDKIKYEIDKLKNEIRDVKIGSSVMSISLYILILFLVIILSSCTTTKYIEKPYPVPEIHEVHVTDTLMKSDTLYVRDSTATAMKGDTIVIEKWHTKYQTKWRDKDKIIVKCDSIPYEVVKTEYVDREVFTWRSGLKMVLSTIAAFCILILIAKLIKAWKQR